MNTKITRRRFLAALAAGTAYLASINMTGCEPLGRSFRVRPLHTPELGPLHIPKRVFPLAGVPSRPAKGVWHFRSRPDLRPPAVEVTKRTHDIAPGYVFVAPENGGPAQGGSLIVDDSGQVVWFRPLPDAFGRAMNFEVQSYRGGPVLTWIESPGQYVSEFVICDDSYREIARFGAGNGYDGDHDNNLLVSARETSAVYKIDRKSGEVIWRLGGKKSDFEMGKGTRFAYQHDARRLPDGTISIFDNGKTVFHNNLPEAIEESRAIVLELDEERMKASLVREYTHPDKQYADAAGNTQVLENSNVFVGWGRALAISEFGEDGELLFDASLRPENKSYRAFRFPWSAKPPDRPAAVAERTSGEEVRVYASWNGATEVESWEALAGRRPGDLKALGSIPRDGFETGMLLRTSEPFVAVRAKDRSGAVLGSSEPVEI